MALGKGALRDPLIPKEVVGTTTKVINMRPYKDPDEVYWRFGAQEMRSVSKRLKTALCSDTDHAGRHDMDDPESKPHLYNEIAKEAGLVLPRSLSGQTIRRQCPERG